MTNSHRPIRFIARALMSAGLAVVGLGMAGQANADGPVEPLNWCPGQPLPEPDVTWGMNACHTYYGVAYHQGNVGDYIWDAAGGPPPAPPQCPPIAFMCP